MNFEYNETQAMIAQSIRDFAEQHIRPNIMDWDESQHFPVDLFKKLGEMGFMGVLVPEELGGSGLGYHEYITVVEEISKVDPSIGLSVAAHNSLCTNHILTFGNEEQKKKWIPKLATAEHIGAWGLTEHNTGSDAGGMNTTAVKDGDHWIVNGAKNFITHAKSGDIAVVIVRTGEKGDSKGMTAFVFEKGMPGFTSGKKEDKLGMRASETAELIFDNCRIPDSHRLGEVGEGFIQAMKKLTHQQIILFNQSVLLKGINDDPMVLTQLSYRLFEAHVLPYYLHVLDKVSGAAHFLITDAQAQNIYQKLLKELPGYLVPKLVRETHGELHKTPLNIY